MSITLDRKGLVTAPAAIDGTTSPAELLRAAESFLTRYLSFPSPDYAFACALWAAATYLWPDFDAFPYLVITSFTKRSGKSRLSELLQFLSSNPLSITGATAAAVFRSIDTLKPTLFIDEAETLANGEASNLRSVLNTGYRRGSTVMRATLGGEVDSFSTYCPKCFVLIGDVYDTLRDRSIVVGMRRGAAPSRFVYTHAQEEGGAIGTATRAMLTDAKNRIMDVYTSHPGLDYLPDRDAEIWLPLVAVCTVMAPERLIELQRVSVDMATEKTLDLRKHTELAGAEHEAENEEYSIRLLRDMLTVMGAAKSLFTTDALTGLHELPTGPWRKFRGEGLKAMDMAALLSPLGVKPKLIKVGSKSKHERVARGYTREAITKALKDARL
jgi:uncharacterized protein DUF3631